MLSLLFVLYIIFNGESMIISYMYGNVEAKYGMFLSHDQDTIHAEMGNVEMRNFRMAALMFLTNHGIKERAYAHAEITHFPMKCITRTWKELGLQPSTPQALMMHLVGKCAISAWTWVLAI